MREPSALPVAVATENDPRIAAYLDRVEARLPSVVPEERRQELRAELRAHLEALVAAHQELGSEPAAAALAALAQFGDADRLARSWAGEWRRGARPRITPWMAALSLPLLLFGLALGLLGGLGMAAGLEASLLQQLLGPLPALAAGLWAGLGYERHPAVSRRALVWLGVAALAVSAALPVPGYLPWLPFVLCRAMMTLVTGCSAAGLGEIWSAARGWRAERSELVRL